MYKERFYRKTFASPVACSFVVQYRETDLWICIERRDNMETIRQFILDKVISLHRIINAFIKTEPCFLTALTPLPLKAEYPAVIKKMIIASQAANVGPMAAVAGTFSDIIGAAIRKHFKLNRVIIENGGDNYIYAGEAVTTAIFAGKSPFSNRIGLRFKKEDLPLGVCTSSGTVGPSLSFGNADAVTIVCKEAALADAYATFFGNAVKTDADFPGILEAAKQHTDITGIVLIYGDKIGIQGKLELIPVNNQV